MAAFKGQPFTPQQAYTANGMVPAESNPVANLME